MASLTKWVSKRFNLPEQHTTFRTEIQAGLTTFLTMSYILFINPVILSSAGMNPAAVFIATCLVSALGCVLVGLLSNYPIAIAPGMTLNVYFAYTVVQGLKFSWQSALGAVCIAGSLFLIMSLTDIRRLIISAIPNSLAVALSAGLGLFIALIALKSANIIVPHPSTLLSLGPVISLPGLLFLLSLCLTVALDYYRIPGAIILGILASTLVSLFLKLVSFHGLFALPNFTQTNFLALDFSQLWSGQGISVILTFLIVALFDSTGTLVGLLHHLNISHTNKKNKRLSKALVAESLATISASMLGTSGTNLFIESSAGIQAGGRTGLTALTIGALFILALFFAPIAQTIPPYAIAAALFYIACLMMNSIRFLNWDDATDSIPSLIVTLMIPFTFSIAIGFGLGIISYILIKLCCRKLQDLNPILLILGGIFVLYFLCRVD